jgi:hypothetical protein
MDQVREKPKILLFRRQLPLGAGSEAVNPWANFCKALKTFTVLEEREVNDPILENPGQFANSFDHVFLDAGLANWDSLGSETIPNLTLVSIENFPWTEVDVRSTMLKGLVRHPCFMINAFNASDLLRALHLFLFPKRMAGVTPLMEKGSTVLGEKVLDINHVGTLLDRFATFCDHLDGFTLKNRVSDLRQVLSGLIFEGFRCAKNSQMIYPFVEFQVSAGRSKLGVNLRFPRGRLSVENLPSQILSGQSLFWHQIWQCSDFTMITHHKQHDELEVMILINQPERNPQTGFHSLIFKTLDQSARKENFLEAPEDFAFKLLSEIQLKDAAHIQIFESNNDSIENIDLGGLPEPIVQKINHLTEQVRQISDLLQRKDHLLQESIRKNQSTSQDLNAKRAELLRAVKSHEVQFDASEKRISLLETQIEHFKRGAQENVQAKTAHNSATLQDIVTKLEATLRASESEKLQLRETLAHDQKKHAMLELKYSSLYKENAQKEREVNDLKSAVNKLRREQTQKQQKQAEEGSGPGNLATEIKEASEREIHYKQEIKKLSFKLENQEKNIRSMQNDAVEKAKLLDQKLKAAKVKEVELLKRIEELTINLKKAIKAA